MTDMYSPLSERYAGQGNAVYFFPDMKFKTWRKLWIALAEAEMELGLADENGEPRITPDMIEELRANAENINYEVAKEREKLVRHDVMSHVYAYGCEVSEKTAGVIHLGATSCYVGDNTDVIIMTEGLRLVRRGSFSMSSRSCLNLLWMERKAFRHLPLHSSSRLSRQPSESGRPFGCRI